MPSVWDVSSNYRLLFHMVEQCNPKVSWESVAAAMGGGFTAEACRQHFAKLKKTMSDGTANPNGNGGAGSPVPATPTPRKRKAREPKAPSETPVKRPRKNAKKAQDDGDNDEGKETA
ncbi:uncharacterized protein CIMG_06260 [Coccidioides immitis RS]|uniref:Myb-like domain-containing protein n=2 Tax=Coccidioides immitis TaxID=5501 RepID=J3K7S4_COCIM|nr:uncharacterized protein CIMG_06260 [Coccidioides immitis RS]EAS30781.3 hypothetical protein CIMG_06260 [Coccidioides immitis RS]KMU73901.1 hypothetical protein CISG_03879 [Coccidioides immitis RMSCC 3703]TPX23679.1 hypothetical protein DIZ76_013015 [Coccidioides immitis]